MIHFNRSRKPADFDLMVRDPGRQWLDADPATRAKTPPTYWTHCLHQLALAFRHLCGYSAMLIGLDGAVDHYLSQSDHPELMYQWSNYRYSSPRINSFKWAHGDKILDPFEVKDGWFEVQLGSWQLVMTDQIPGAHRERAKFTLEQLRLGSDDYGISRRRCWYCWFCTGKQSLLGLKNGAPLVYRAVMNVIDPVGAPATEEGIFREFLQGLVTLPKLYEDAPQIAARLRDELPPCPARYGGARLNCRGCSSD